MSSYPKGNRSSTKRAANPRKRKFHGNRFTSKSNEETEVKPNSSANQSSTASTNDIIVHLHHYYRIIEFFTVFNALTDIIICRSCKQSIQFAESGHRGLGFKIILSCVCGRREINSGPLMNSGFEINRRIVFAMKLSGIGRKGINLFCCIMDMCQGFSKSTYDTILQHIHAATYSMFNSVCEKAVKEEQEKNIENQRIKRHLKVSGDGSWKNSESTLLFGVTTLIGYYTGKIIDLIVKRAYCQLCASQKASLNDNEFEEWYEIHKESCTLDNEDSRRKMEADLTVKMFSRSEEKFGVKYTNYIGSGNSKTFTEIVDINPYGDECPVVKHECVRQVQKRMGGLLHNVKKEQELGGKKCLTNGIIEKLTVCYGLAIRRNVDSVENMKKGIVASLDHYCSTDILPRHGNCTPGAESSCEWRKAEATNSLASYKHPARLIHEDIESHIRPVYEEMSNDELLTRCLGGHIQNSRMSFNATVRQMNPDHVNSGQKEVEIAAFMAAGKFNEGYSAILKAMQLLDLKIGQQCKMFVDNIDKQRIEKQHRFHYLCSKEARTVSRLEQTHRNQFYEGAEGLLCTAEIAE